MITINKTQHIVQLTEEEAKRVAEEAVKDYKSLCKTGTVAFIAAVGIYAGTLIYDSIRTTVAQKKLDESMNEALNTLHGKGNANTEA